MTVLYIIEEIYHEEGNEPRREIVDEYDNLRSAMIKKGYLDAYNEYGYIQYEVVEVQISSSALVVGYPEMDKLLTCTDAELWIMFEQQKLNK